MMDQLVTGVQEEAALNNNDPPLTLAVTVLTSIAQSQLENDMFITNKSVEETVVAWARMAQECGINGVVCSPQEITAIRNACGRDFKIVTPGIRPSWSATNDQKRITTPKQALTMGADYMVVGRPITAADNPRAAALRIIEELEG